MSTLIIIAGPTASGKTELAISLANRLNSEIINADSRQFYRLLNIGTAKPTFSQLSAAKHHFIDILNPDESYNAGKFESAVIHFLDHYFQQNDVAIMVGGSGLYLKAVLQGFDDLPVSSEEARKKWSNILNEKGISALQEALLQKDPAYAREVDLNNPQRLQRALEVMEESDNLYSQLRQQTIAKRNFKSYVVCLNPARDQLYERINHRVDTMMAEGLLEEAASLMSYKNANALQTVGYKELFEYLDGKTTKNQAIEKIKQHTRNFAKRQYTWFKAQPDYHFLEHFSPDIVWKHLRDKSVV